MIAVLIYLVDLFSDIWYAVWFDAESLDFSDPFALFSECFNASADGTVVIFKLLLFLFVYSYFFFFGLNSR